jgi:hypothetical protein
MLHPSEAVSGSGAINVLMSLASDRIAGHLGRACNTSTSAIEQLQVRRDNLAKALPATNEHLTLLGSVNPTR